MNILTVSAFFESHGGGIEVVAGALARALDRGGHESRWAAAGFDSPPSDVATMPLEAFDPIERLTGLPLPLLRRSARRELDGAIRSADAVIVHDSLYASSLLAARLAERHQKPWVLVQHIGAIPYRSPVLRAAMGVANRLATRPLLGRASQAVFISDAVRRQFPDVRFRKAPKLLFNGVDHALFRAPLPGEAARLRVGLGLSETRPQLLFVGRFVEKKGLASLRALAAARPNWDLLLAGGGPIDPAAWQLANVRVLGRKSRHELAELYRAAHALVLPSVGEGFPLVIQEAMASGLPVFCGLDSAAADPDAASFLHGIPVDPSDPAGTAARFAQAIAEAPLEPDPIMAAYARAAYDWDGNARWLVQAISNSRA